MTTTETSATLAGDLPDSGFRISFADYLEEDTYTYFVKRFGSNAGYLNSIKLELTRNTELSAVALNAHQEINAKIK